MSEQKVGVRIKTSASIRPRATAGATVVVVSLGPFTKMYLPEADGDPARSRNRVLSRRNAFARSGFCEFPGGPE